MTYLYLARIQGKDWCTCFLADNWQRLPYHAIDALHSVIVGANDTANLKG